MKMQNKTKNRGETPCPHCEKGISKKEDLVLKHCPHCGKAIEPQFRGQGRGAKVKKYIKLSTVSTSIGGDRETFIPCAP